MSKKDVYGVHFFVYLILFFACGISEICQLLPKFIPVIKMERFAKEQRVIIVKT